MEEKLLEILTELYNISNNVIITNEQLIFIKETIIYEVELSRIKMIEGIVGIVATILVIAMFAGMVYFIFWLFKSIDL